MFRRQKSMNDELVVALRHNNSHPLGFNGGPPTNAYSANSIPPPPSRERQSYFNMQKKGSFGHVSGPSRGSGRSGLLQKFREASSKGGSLLKGLPLPKPNNRVQQDLGGTRFRGGSLPLPPPNFPPPPTGQESDDDDDGSAVTEWTDSGEPVPPRRTFTPPQSLMQMAAKAKNNKAKTKKKKQHRSAGDKVEVSYKSTSLRAKMPRRPEHYGQSSSAKAPSRGAQTSAGNRKETVFGFNNGQVIPPPPPQTRKTDRPSRPVLKKVSPSSRTNKYVSPTELHSTLPAKTNRPNLQKSQASSTRTGNKRRDFMTSVPPPFQVVKPLATTNGSPSSKKNNNKRMKNRNTGTSIGARKATMYGFGPGQAMPPPPPSRKSGGSSNASTVSAPIVMSRRSLPHARPPTRNERLKLQARRPKVEPKSPVRPTMQPGRSQRGQGKAPAKKAASVPPRIKPRRVNTGRSNKSEHFGPRPSMYTMSVGDVGRLTSKFEKL